MRVQIGGGVRTGEAVDLRSLDVDGRAIVRAIRGEESPATVACPDPTPVHEYVGHVVEGTTVRTRTALAAVARQRGLSAPQDEELAAVREELASLEPPEVPGADARERAAAIDEEQLASLREMVAARRGEVQARRELDAGVEDALEELSEAAGRLAAVETDRVAAEQALREARRRARAARDVRDRRLELEDREGNLARAAREHLAGELAGEFAAAVEAVPGEGRVPGPPSTFEGDDVTAALAIARIAPLCAPVVLECDRFSNAREAARCLGASVILV